MANAMQPGTPAPATTERRYRLAVGGAVLLSLLMRVRFVFAPIGSDEGGFLAIARAWRHGAVLYRDVWVDRPQGLLLVFRVYDMALGNEDIVRVLALVFGALAVVAVGAAVRSVAGAAAGAVAAVLAAALSASPAIEGYAANGELLSGTMSAVAVAVACAVFTGRRSERWMWAAGVFGASAWSIKQSGLDGLVAVGAVLVLAWIVRWIPMRTAVARLGRLTGGAALVVALSALHGALTDWSDWAYAIWGYRLEQRSALVNANWDRMFRTGADALPLFLPVIAAAAVCAVVLRRRGRPLADHWAAAVFVCWPLVASASFLLGGQFFHHYWVILTLPVAALSGMVIGRVEVRRRRWGAVAVSLLPLAVSWALLVVVPDDRVLDEVYGDTRSPRAEVVGHWLADEMEPGDTLYVLCAAAQTYAHAGADPTYRYLWFDGVRQAKDAQRDLDALFTGDAPPTWVAGFDAPGNCSRSGAVEQALRTRYRPVGRVDGIEVFRLTG